MICHLVNVLALCKYFTSFEYDVISNCPNVEHLNASNFNAPNKKIGGTSVAVCGRTIRTSVWGWIGEYDSLSFVYRVLFPFGKHELTMIPG